jgi:hypothetical protein
MAVLARHIERQRPSDKPGRRKDVMRLEGGCYCGKVRYQPGREGEGEPMMAIHTFDRQAFHPCAQRHAAFERLPQR